MAIISLSGAYSAPKRRPRPYKARDAAYQVGGNPGYYIAARPRPYPMTSQQRKVKEAARACGIRPGITKKELQEKMKGCIPDQMRKK